MTKLCRRFALGAVRLALPLTLTAALGACAAAGAPPQYATDASGAAAYPAQAGYYPSPAAEAPHNTESYSAIDENGFKTVAAAPLSTFSVDVDTASYANVRRFLDDGQLPVADAVRIEELINYFPYDYAPPSDGKPFAVHSEVSSAPWLAKHRLVRIGIKGKEVAPAERKPANLVFLLDVSGSMEAPNKLPLLRASLKLLVDRLDQRDKVSIVVYAGASGVVLEPTSCGDKTTIMAALSKLQAGGSTAGAEGIMLAYEKARQTFDPNGINRVILATDGDFNVGPSSEGELQDIIEEQAKSGVFLTVLGFGMGNYKDSTLELLADKGNGNYAYIDHLPEARKVLVEQMGATLETIAKDVKIQVEFNPAEVAGYRLIGYENRLLADEDFNDDTKDAGDIGAGHTVTALYEVVPAGLPVPGSDVDPLKYQTPGDATEAAASGELLTLKLRYKAPDGDQSQLIELSLRDDGRALAETSNDFRFAAATAAFGMVLRDSKHRGSSNYESVLEWARPAVGQDPGGYRAEMLRLVETARSLSR